jgi:EpsI family protein
MVTLLGVNVIRLIWFPVLYLLFLVPTGEYLIVPMQNFAAHFVDVSLTILGIAHYTDGTTFELTNGRFEIAEACAGLRFLIATVTLGVLVSYMMFRKIHKTALFLIACVAVPLFGNGLRCLGIIVLAHFTNNEYGAGADHIVYGWGFNVAILLVLGLAGSLFRDDFSDTDEVRPAAGVRPNTLALVSALAILLLGTGPALTWWHDNDFVRPDLAAIGAPLESAGWQIGLASTAWHSGFTDFDAQMAASITRDGDTAGTPVDYFLSYYARPRPGHSMTAHTNRFWTEPEWNLSGTGAITASLGGKPVRFQEWIISAPGRKRLIWSSYWVDGRFTSSLFQVKLLQTAAALQGHEGEAALALSTVINGSIDEARISLAHALPALKQLPARLAQANHRLDPSPAQGGR